MAKKTALIVRQMYKGKESLVCYLSRKYYKEKSMSWAIYDIGKNTVISSLTNKIVELQFYGYNVAFMDEIEAEKDFVTIEESEV